jgi:hypothetical protein
MGGLGISMMKPIKKSQLLWAILAVVSLATGCDAPGKTGIGDSTGSPATSPRGILQTTRMRADSVSTNGIWQNGLSTNGIWQNGIWQNGIWQNGIWQNGIWQNGIWQNGIWQNGIWQNGIWQNGTSVNGIWQNGIWQNGIWQNGIWQNGLPGLDGGLSGDGGSAQSALPGDTLRASQYARQLLTYVYGCAMPPPVCPTGGGQPISDYDTSIDPNVPSISCTPSSVPCPVCPADGVDASGCGLTQGTCDFGYVCMPQAGNSTQGTCVVPLNGAIGLAVNGDGTHWWDPPAAADAGPGDGGANEAGSCDESCQRWISACVLARTNAYGEHVFISMRAPADAPADIQKALQLGPGEANTYTVREGAYYGNIFETTPVGNPPASGPGSAPDGGPGPATGPVVESPAFYACAGPDSNVPELTRRFCSSQGDQVVIHVPGQCVPPGATPGSTFTGSYDGGPETPICDSYDSTGSLESCHTSAARTDKPYDQVITVYLTQPVVACGNLVCEAPTETPTSCPSDCHPGTWTKDYSPNLDVGGVYNPLFVLETAPFRVSAVGSDGSVAVIANACAVNSSGECLPVDMTIGGQTFPASEGFSILAKYDSTGTFLWGTRFGATPPAGFAALQGVYGVTVGNNTSVSPSSPAYQGNITIAGVTTPASNPADQVLWISSFEPTKGNALGTWILPILGGGNLTPDGGTLTFDSAGNLILAAFCANPTPLSIGGSAPPGQFTFSNSSDTCLIKTALPASSEYGQVAWAQSVGTTDGFAQSVAADKSGNVVLVTSDNGGKIWKFCTDGSMNTTCQDGTKSWSGGNVYSAAAVDPSGNIYAAGVSVSNSGVSTTFLQELDPNGQTSLGMTPPVTIACPPNLSCTESGVQGVGVVFDSNGNVVLASFGDPAIGGTIDFGLGPFPTYDSRDIFLTAYSASNLSKVVWAKQVPMILSSGFAGMAITPQGQVVVSGSYSGSMQFDDALLVTGIPQDPATVDSFVASFAEPSPLATGSPRLGAGFDGTGAPLNTLPGTIIAQAASNSGACVFYMPPTAIDDGNAADGGPGGGPPGTTVTCTPPPNTTFPIGTTTVQCTATNSLGETSPVSTFNVKVGDTVGPAITQVPGPISRPANALGGAQVTYTAPLAVDQVDSSPSSCSSCGNPLSPPPALCAAPSGGAAATCTPASGSVFPVGLTTVNCKASDSHGNTSSASFTVTVTDASGPVISISSASQGALGPGGAVVTYSATATDLVDGTAPVTCNPPSGSTFPVGATTVVCTATDKEGLVSTLSSTVTVVDNAAPVLTVPGNINAVASGPSGAVVTYSASATDAVDGTDPVTCTPASGSTFPVGATSVTCTATDTNHLTSIATFTVTVKASAPPVVTVPSNITASATGASGAVVTFSSSATDAADGTDPVTCTPPSGSTFPIGATVVTCTATDSLGGVGTSSFTVTVVDKTLPVVTVPSNITTTATSASGAVVTFSASATDLVDGTDPVTCTPPSGSTFPVGTTVVTCTATDKNGLAASATFIVTVKASAPPVVTVPSNITTTATSASGAVVTFSASATDAVDGTDPVTCSPASGSTFPIGATVVTCTATDSLGNVATATFTVTVLDSALPVVTVPSNITTTATGASGAVVTFSASATDLVDGTDPVTCSPASGSTFPIGATVVTCTATDNNGNASSATFTVTVTDTASPTLTLPGAITATATSTKGATVTYSVSATDPVDGSITPVCAPASGSTFPLGTTTVTCTATDAHGNTATGSFPVQVQYAWSGLLLPIHTDGSSIFELGSTVEVRFGLSGASAGITNASATLTVTKLSSTVAGTHREAPSSLPPTSGTTFKYNPATKHYYFNLGTSKLSTGTYSLSIDLHDGVSRTAQISLQRFSCGDCEHEVGDD